jgi:CubicO group peptidase (beta-lactamase class C family)
MRLLTLYFPMNPNPMLWLACAAMIACEHPPDTLLTSNPLVTDLDQTVDAHARPYMQDPDHVGLSIGIWTDSQAYYYGYGETAQGNGQLPDLHTIFEIGSISKTFSAALLTDALAAHGMSPETPISQLLPPDIPKLQHGGQEILVKHLLNHSSGLPRIPDDLTRGWNRDNPYAHYDSTKVYAFLRAYTLTRTPGTEHAYSNLASGLAGLILERLTGKSFEQNLTERLTQPLGLLHTSITVPAGSDFAKGYTRKGRETPYWDLAGLKAAGGIRSTTSDMLQYGRYQLGGAPSPLDTLFARCQVPTFTQTGEPAFEVGLGWFLISLNGHTCLYHDGGTGGFSSHLFICPATQQVVTLLMNGTDEDAVATLGFGLAAEVIE